MDLLSRLSHWARRQDENFLTESFVHLLQYLLQHEEQAAARLLNQFTQGFLNITANGCRDITITTQVTTDEGRPDIEVRTPKALVYIEVKAQSGLGARQIERYRSVLNKSGYQKTLLCLLTRYPLEDGEEHEPDLHIRWYQVYEILSRVNIDVDVVGRYLVTQFMEFLEHKGIVMEHVGWQLIDGVKSLQNLVNMLGRAIESNGIKFKPLSGGKTYIGYYTDEKNNWIGLLYEDPAQLKFEINTSRVPEKAELKKVSLTEADMDAQCRISTYVDLSSEDSHFFARDKTSQLKFLESEIKSWRKMEQKIRQMGL